MIEKLRELLNEQNVPCTVSGFDPEYLYYPQRAGYILRVRHYPEDTEVSLHSSGGEWIMDTDDLDALVKQFTTKHFGRRQVTDLRSEEIGRLQAFDSGCSSLSRYARNLNLLALQGKIFRAYGRDEETEQVLRIMLRKTKSNALLVGAAGCGKTAIVENLAHYLVDSRLDYLRSMEEQNRAKRLGEECDAILPPLFNDTVIYDLDIAGMVAGTKYRGEFEERLTEILQVLEKNSNIILFIDEIHQLNGIGQAEGSGGMGQLIKPALARGTIRCIGATTDDEVKIIHEDRALSRRFNQVKVLPLGGEKALMAAEKILQDYSAIHAIKVEGVTAAELLHFTDTKLKGTSFPDNYINLLDETMAGAKFQRKAVVGKADFESTLTRLLGADIVSVKIGNIGFNI